MINIDYRILMLVCSIVPLVLKADLPNIKDPFLKPPIISCDELVEQLVSQLNLWQYQGHISTKKHKQSETFVAWMTNQKEWFSINNLHASTPFISWKIQTVSPSNIQWQATLPNYCRKQLAFSMKLKEE